jgi:4-amino-4-deoxy-L-arabinose transferase-like glycosyltransferase
MPHRVNLLLIILAAAAVYLVGNGRVPLWDRDEPRNAQAARQMFQSGDWVVPRFLDKVRTAKPPFTYWMQATAMHVFGDGPFAARFPSPVAMTLTLILLAVVLSRWDDPKRAFWTVLVLATSALVIAWCAKTSLTDAVLLLWVTIAQLCLYAILRGCGTWPVIITLAAALGLALLTKGPVVLGVQVMTLLVLAVLNWKRIWYRTESPRGFEVLPTDSGMGVPPVSLAPPQEDDHAARDHGRSACATVKAVVAVLIVLAIGLPWAILVEHRAPGFLLTSTSHDVARRIFEPLEQHKGPPGYYALVLWGIYFPWSVLLPMTFVMAWRNRREPRVRFALAAVIGPWLMLECVQTKLPHYLLPVFPPLAYLTADAIVRGLRGEHRDLFTRGMRATIAAWAVIVVGIGLLPWLAWGKFDGLPVAAMVAFSLVGVAYAVAVYVPFHRLRPRRGLIAMGVGMMLAMTVAFGWYLPAASSVFGLSACLGERLHRAGGGADQTTPGDVQMIAYKEPSLAFYQGGTIREQSENDFLATHPPEQWPTWTVIREDVWQRMPASVKQRLEVVGSCRGLDLADKGRVWRVYVVRKRRG